MNKNRTVLWGLIAAGVVTGSSCNAVQAGLGGERMKQGIAQLSVANAGAIAGLINVDTECGFTSPGAVASAVVEGTPGTTGTITLTTTCAWDFGDGTMISPPDCRGLGGQKATGTVTVLGTRTVRGLVTGDPQTPIVPAGPEAVSIHLDLITRGFGVFPLDDGTSSDAPNDDSEAEGAGYAALVWEDARVAVDVTPKLAESIDEEAAGVCAAVTGNSRLSNLTLAAPTPVTFHTDRLPAPTMLQLDELVLDNAWFGLWDDDHENLVQGRAVIDGQEVLLDGELSPGYDRQAFLESWTVCAEDGAASSETRPAKLVDGQPSYTCSAEPLRARLISGAARLTVGQLGALASLLQDDTSCGFASAKVIEDVELTGEIGRRGGTATYRIEDCILDFPEPTVIKEASACGEAEVVAEGRVIANGTLTLGGWLASPDDKAQPIVPDSWAPARLELTVEHEGFTISNGRPESLTVVSGTLSGTVVPQLGLDDALGACSIPTGAATLSDLTWSENTLLQLNAGSQKVQVEVDSAQLEAVNGAFDGRENHLEGTMRVGGVDLAVPFDEPGLVPGYDAARAEQDVLACQPNLVIPTSSSECRFYSTLGGGAARLLVSAMGSAATVINTDATCGFGISLIPNAAILGSVVEPADAAFGERASLSFDTDELDAEGCEHVFDDLPPSTDCLGTESWAEGAMRIQATRVVGGELECALPPLLGLCVANSIVPLDHSEVDVHLRSVEVTEFAQHSLDTDGNAGPAVLTLHAGTISGHVFPILGAQADDPARFMVPTPNALLREVSAEAIDATLEAEGRIFHFTIDSSSLTAFNGSWAGDGSWNAEPIPTYAPGSVFERDGPYENSIRGAITVDGVGLILDDEELVPGFERKSFEDAWLCEEVTPNLLAPPAQASP